MLFSRHHHPDLLLHNMCRVRPRKALLSLSSLMSNSGRQLLFWTQPGGRRCFSLLIHPTIVYDWAWQADAEFCPVLSDHLRRCPPRSCAWLRAASPLLSPVSPLRRIWELQSLRAQSLSNFQSIHTRPLCISQLATVLWHKYSASKHYETMQYMMGGQD